MRTNFINATFTCQFRGLRRRAARPRSRRARDSADGYGQQRRRLRYHSGQAAAGAIARDAGRSTVTMRLPRGTVDAAPADMRILIADDEPLARTRLAALLGQCDDVDVIAAVADGEAALAACIEHGPDLLVADIDMPGLDGTELTRRLATQPRPPQVVFCTAYEHFAAQAYELGAADYLLKPVGLARLREALARAGRLRAPAPRERAVLGVRMGGEERRIPLDEVYCLLADDKYVTVHHAGGESLVDTSLRQLEQQHPDALLRLHRNCVIPRKRLLGIVSGDGQARARLAGCALEPEISRRNLAAVRRLLHGG